MKKLSLRKHVLTTALALTTLPFLPSAQAQWLPVGTPGFSPGGLSNWQNLVIDPNDTLYVAFNDEGLPAGQGTVMKYDGTNWVSVGTPGFTPGIAHHSSFALGPNNTAYFSFADGTAASMSRAAVMKYDGTTWTSIGSNLSVNECQYSNIRVAANGNVYMGMIDNATSGGTVVVKKYDGTGTSWTTLGTTPISTPGASYSSMALGQNDTIYIAFRDLAQVNKVTVKKYDGTDWVQVGSSFLSQPMGGAYDINLKFDHNHVPYVAYWNPAPSGPKASVHRWDGTNWVLVGPASFPTGITQFTTLAFDNSNTPYIGFMDNTTGTKANVMKYDGTNWVSVGTPDFSAGVAAYTYLAIDGNGNPYMAYYDGANGQKTTVMKYSVCNPPTVPTITTSSAFICKGDTMTLTAAGTLNDAAKWYWFTGSCGGTLVDSGATIKVAPGDTTTYYVRGLGNCVQSGPCKAVTVYVDEALKPSITVAGAVLTSSAGSGNQWYKSNTALAGATNPTYTVTSTGWYKVRYTNANGCSALSDSVFVTPSGVQQILPGGDIKVYPSPFTDKMHISIGNRYQDLNKWHLVLTDNTGRQVYTQEGLDHENDIRLKHLSPGIYLMYLETPGGKQVLKVVKQ